MRAPHYLILLLVLLPASSFANQDRLAAGEILVEVEEVPGSEVPKLSSIGVVDAPATQIWAIVSECDHYADRLPRIDSARVLRRDGSTVYCEVTVDLPFPLSNLTAETRGEHTVGPPEWRREWTLVEGDYTRNDGSWVLVPFRGNPNRTLVTYTVHAEPKTNIPENIRRHAQERSMPAVIERLRELVE